MVVVSLRVAQVCPSYDPVIGGVQMHVKQISAGLTAKGFDVEVLTTDSTRKLQSEENVDGILVRRFPSWAPKRAYFLSPSLKRYLSMNVDRYDIVHAHNYHAFPALYAAQAKSRNRFIFTPRYHGAGHTFLRNLLHYPYKFLAREIFDRSDMIISLSDYERKLLLSKFALPEQKITWIPNGINKREFDSLPMKRTSNHKTALCVSRLEKYKGMEELIRVVPRLPLEISVEIIGQGPHKASLVNLVDALGLQNRIKIESNIPRKDLMLKYAEAGVFVLLSRYEAFGNTVAEALASGTRCVLANTSALSDWIDGENCFGIDYPVNLDRLADLITRVIRKNEEGRASVRLLDWNDVVERVAKVYTA